MRSIFEWLKRNWQIATIVILAFLLFRKQPPVFYSRNLEKSTGGLMMREAALPATGRGYDSYQEAAPAPEVRERMVVQNSWFSLLVENVRQTQENIIKRAEEIGGYMVDSRVDSPEGIDSATVSVRVPSAKLDEFLVYVRGLVVRVVSENLVGYDVTDEYVDIQSRLETLNKTKAKFEEILAKAEAVTDILQVQRELINLQQQIDNLKGQEKYLEKTAEMVKVTAYLSTDELALPYAPAQPWRPSAIFKQAVRSLIGHVRSGGTALIWIGVYSVVWLPVLLVVYLLRRRRRTE